MHPEGRQRHLPSTIAFKGDSSTQGKHDSFADRWNICNWTHVLRQGPANPRWALRGRGLTQGRLHLQLRSGDIILTHFLHFQQQFRSCESVLVITTHYIKPVWHCNLPQPTAPEQLEGRKVVPTCFNTCTTKCAAMFLHLFYRHPQAAKQLWRSTFSADPHAQLIIEWCCIIDSIKLRLII